MDYENVAIRVNGVLEENVRGNFPLTIYFILRVQKSVRWSNASSEESVTSNIPRDNLHLCKQPLKVMMFCTVRRQQSLNNTHFVWKHNAFAVV
jgi:hypothetical protein